MTATLAPSGVHIGTRGDVLLLCQCCKMRPQILGVASQGKLTIEKRHHGLHHYVILGPEMLDSLDEARKIACMCCEESGLILAECLDDLLIIRCVRHRKPHFVALARTRLEQVLALSRGVA